MKNLKKIIAGLILIALILLGYRFLEAKVGGGSGGGSGSFQASLIGGQTEGVSDLCCNGTILEFSSVEPQNQNILDGEALWETGKTDSYDYGNEFSEGYWTLGTVSQGVCITIESECESSENVQVINLIGTGGTTD